MQRLGMACAVLAIGATALATEAGTASAAPGSLIAPTAVIKDDGLVEKVRRGQHSGIRSFNFSGNRHNFGLRSYSFSGHRHNFRRSPSFSLYLGTTPYYRSSPSYYNYSSPNCWWSSRWYKWVCQRNYW